MAHKTENFGIECAHIFSRTAALLGNSRTELMKKSLFKEGIYSLTMGLIGLTMVTLMWQLKRDFAFSLIGYKLPNAPETMRTTGVLDAISGIFWIGACLVCIYRIATISRAKKFLLYFWAIFCFLCAGEELKWGLHIFHYSINAIQHINYQGEISLHNLNVTRKFFLSPNRLFWTGFFVYFFILPLLTGSKYINRIKAYFHYITPSGDFIIATWIPILFSYAVTRIVGMGQTITSIQVETREMYAPVVVLFYVFLYLRADNNKNFEKIMGRLKILSLNPANTSLKAEQAAKRPSLPHRPN